MALCAAYSITHHHSSPYTSHSNGAVERLHQTVEDLLRRCLVTLPAEAWTILVPDVQLAVNTTYARSIGCPPYLVMFGTTPPHAAFSAPPDPTTTSLATYASALRRQLDTIQRATQAAHDAYRTRERRTIPEDPVTTALVPGRLAMVIRPAHNKLLTSNAGPFLFTRVEPPHVWLQSLTHGVTLKENVKNVRPL